MTPRSAPTEVVDARLRRAGRFKRQRQFLTSQHPRALAHWPGREVCASPEARHELHAPPHRGLQDLRRSGRRADRAGADRHRRAERLRQVEPRRGAALGDGRELLQELARLRHGGRDLLRHDRTAGAQPRRSRRSPSTTPAGSPPPRSSGRPRSRSAARSRAGSARATASTAARSAPATCSCSSPTPPPARARPRWSARAASARLINARPDQRRRILEEAAGIAGLHQRRREAESRLEGGRGQSRPRRGRAAPARRAEPRR